MSHVPLVRKYNHAAKHILMAANTVPGFSGAGIVSVLKSGEWSSRVSANIVL